MHDLAPRLTAVMRAPHFATATNLTGLVFCPCGAFGPVCKGDRRHLLSRSEGIILKNDCATDIEVHTNELSYLMLYKLCYTSIVFNNKQMLQYLVSTFLAQALACNLNGEMLLHFACMRQANLNIIKLLTFLDSGSLAHKTDKWGGLAFHRVCCNINNCSLLQESVTPQ